MPTYELEDYCSTFLGTGGFVWLVHLELVEEHVHTLWNDWASKHILTFDWSNS